MFFLVPTQMLTKYHTNNMILFTTNVPVSKGSLVKDQYLSLFWKFPIRKLSILAKSKDSPKGVPNNRNHRSQV
jgi:hypothetical protein